MESTLNTLSALNARFIHNHVTNDVESHNRILHPDFVCISSSGRLIQRAEYLKLWANLFDPTVIVYWDTRDENISVFGNVALVRAANKWIEKRANEMITGITCYTDTYILCDAGWFCVQAQLTNVAPEHWSSDNNIISVYVEGQKTR